ncbi:MAG: translation initiation factor IF-2 [Lentisphaeria bacterium]|nr:translation initiation factor IF-2 [Lentisphaeria bacterium]NQZ70462.1 translation initiation factor IF-2 [Lentisphaeria bacterium]
MAKIRVHQLAKTLEISNDDLLAALSKHNIEVKSHLSGLDDESVELITAKLQGGSKTEAKGEEKAKKKPAKEAPKKTSKAKEPKAEAPAEEKTEAPAEAPVEALVEEKAEETSEAPAKEKVAKSAKLKDLEFKTPVIVGELAQALDVKANQLIVELMQLNVMANINQSIDNDIAEKLSKKYGFNLILSKREKKLTEVVEETAPEEKTYSDDETDPRPPIIAFFGHVDHGKTSLQDKMRKSNVAAGEAGGITQHIGASEVVFNGQKITFIDTPGHEAFTQMRARGAHVTDIAVLVVAADDGFMPQTIEALNHARAAGVQIIVAMNKMDLEGADTEKVLRQMMENELMAEEWGGEVAALPVSAETGEGIDELLERIVLETEMMELKANPKLPGQALVIESRIEPGLGPAVNLIVQNGTIKVGDGVICGENVGKVKVLIDASGKRIKSAGPSTPVQLIGLDGLPGCGSKLVTDKNIKKLKKLAEDRAYERKQEVNAPKLAANLEDLFRQMEEGSRKELKVIVKSDVHGTLEAVKDSLSKIESEKINLNIIHSGVGGITDNDVMLASASDAIIVGFHVRVNAGVNNVAKREEVEIRLYSVIYELIAQMKESMLGKLDPELRESVLGKAEILQIFKLSAGKICGSKVQQGFMQVGAKARVYRDNDVIYNGDLASLRRYQDDVKEVREGDECGILLDNFKDFEIGDVIEVYEHHELEVTL